MGMPQPPVPPQAPPANAGPATIPQGNPGNIKKAAELLNIALQAMNGALPNIPLGSPVHEKIMKMVIDLQKTMKEAAEDMKGSLQQMKELMMQMKAKQAQAGQAGLAAPPNQGPAMPQGMPAPGGPPPPGPEGM
jgi:hypothetical protein